MKEKTIPRIPAKELTPEVFSTDYQQQSKPVIITGLLVDLPEWDLDYLCANIGNEIFPVRLYQESNHSGVGSGVKSQNMTLNQYAELLRQPEGSNPGIYLGKCSLKNTVLADSPLLKNAERQIGLQNSVTGFNLWLGRGGHTTALHYDPFDGTLMQLSGEKQVILFPPSQLYNLYPLSVFNHLRFGQKIRCNHSKLSLDSPDLEKFPNFTTAKLYKYEVTLSEGEILYIPAGWWHEVKLLGNQPVCSINRWWLVSPVLRSITCWSQWRVHLGTILAIPHILVESLSVIFAKNSEEKLKQFIQKL